MPDWKDAEVTERTAWTDNLFSLRFRADIGGFRAGQFVRVALEIDGEMVARPYSLVNAPGDADKEILFNIVPQGPLTPRLAMLRQGDRIKVADKPYGFLTIEELPEARHLWMLATGTGVGPFLSMLQSAQAWQRFDTVVLAYSVRTAAELAYRDVIAGIQQRNRRQLRFLPLVTRQAVDGTINKRITAALASGELERHAGVDIGPDDSHVMMCGNSAMIADVTEILTSRNMRKHLRREPGHITTEKYH